LLNFLRGRQVEGSASSWAVQVFAGTVLFEVFGLVEEKNKRDKAVFAYYKYILVVPFFFRL
jgi:hypothetical protein